jgi:hypothetical protein
VVVGLLSLCFSLCLLLPSGAAAAPPANDDFVNAQGIASSLPVTVPASNIGATAEPGEPAIFGNAAISTVWFKWTAPSSGVIVVNLCGAGFTGSPSALVTFAVRTGSAVNSLSLVAEMSGECSLRFNAVAGTLYTIQVDYRNNQGNFNFRMRQLTPPANDNFASAQTIGPGLPITLNASNLDSTWQSGEPSLLGGSSRSRSVWFNWTSGLTGPVRLDVCEFTAVSGPTNRSFGVYTGNVISSLNPIATGSTNCQLDFNAVFGQLYRIAFSGDIAGEGDFVLRMESAPPPANDNFASAQAVGPDLPVSADGDNTFATAETGEPAHSGIGPAARSVWFSWTPTTSARVRIGSCSPSFTSRIGVYTGNSVNALTTVGELPPYAPHCRITLDAVAGTTYRIAAAGGVQVNTFGPLKLDIHVERIPVNDNFAAARRIGPSLPLLLGGTTMDASYEQFEPKHDKYDSVEAASVWYRWKAGPSARTMISACAAGFPTSVAVYTGGKLANLKRVAQADEGCPAGTAGGKVVFRPRRGTVYHIVVASLYRDFDTRFKLSVTADYRFNLPKALRKCRKIGSKKRRTRCSQMARRKAATAKCRSKATPRAARICLKGVKRRFS